MRKMEVICSSIAITCFISNFFFCFIPFIKELNNNMITGFATFRSPFSLTFKEIIYGIIFIVRVFFYLILCR